MAERNRLGGVGWLGWVKGQRLGWFCWLGGTPLNKPKRFTLINYRRENFHQLSIRPKKAVTAAIQ